MATFSNTNPAVVAFAAKACGWSKTVDIKADGALEWFGETEHPTDQQIFDAIPAAQNKFDVLNAMGYSHEEAYKQLRSAKYPPITDYIDGVVKGDQAQIDKYIADCLAVKAKYPKPE
jgi:hypothetical protein